MVKKYRKLPVVIEAVQFLNNSNEIDDFVGETLFKNMNGTNEVEEIIIPTLEGELYAAKGDFIIKGIKGEFYPCKPDIFEKTYECIDD